MVKEDVFEDNSLTPTNVESQVIPRGRCAALREAQQAGGEWSECTCAINLCDVPVGGKQIQCVLAQTLCTVPHVGCLPVTSSAKIHVSPSNKLAAHC